MKRMMILVPLLVLVVVALQVPNAYACTGWVTGGGTIGVGDTLDSFGGCAMTMKDGSVRGEWTHVDHFDVTGSSPTGQNILHGEVHYLVLKLFPTLNGPHVPKAEPNYANFGGTGTFNGVSGYFFDVKVFDHSEPGAFHDRYVIDIYDPNKKLVLHADGTTSGTCLEDPTVTPDLAWVLDMGCLSGGNIQIHPPNAGHP